MTVCDLKRLRKTLQTFRRVSRCMITICPSIMFIALHHEAELVLGLQGTTRVALYGLGNVRDERLGRMFQTPGCVDWWVSGTVLLCSALHAHACFVTASCNQHAPLLRLTLPNNTAL